MHPLDEVESLFPWWVKPLFVGLVLIGLVVGAYCRGSQDADAEWQAKQNADLVKAQEDLLRANTLNRELTSQNARVTFENTQRYQKGIDDANAKNAAVLADLRAHVKRLSIPIKPLECTTGTAVGGTSTDPAGTATETRAELSDPASQFLVDLTRDADKTVIKMNTCIDNLIECRAVVKKRAN